MYTCEKCGNHCHPHMISEMTGLSVKVFEQELKNLEKAAQRDRTLQMMSTAAMSIVRLSADQKV